MSRWIAPAALLATALLAAGCMEPPTRRKSTLSAQTTASTTSPTTAPAEEARADGGAPASQRSPDTELHRPTHHNFPALMAYRPIYVLVGPEVPNVKFQFSTKIPLLFPGGPDEPDPVLSNLYFGYTQMSLWDIKEPGKATIDTTYMPELFFATQTPPVDFHGFAVSGVGLQAGGQHESNGRSGDASRNANYLYVQPTVFFGDRESVHAEVALKGRLFVATLKNNPDLEDYYGHVELFTALRFGDGLHVTATSRLGDHPDRGAIEVDVTYPLRRLRLDAYMHLQYFNGFTESLLEYNESHQAVRLGVSFVR
jgi:outer membrane phospholipase A